MVDEAGSKVFEVEVPYEKAVVRQVQAGSYRLVFSVRPCDANCGNLDPLAEQCSSSFDVHVGEEVALTVVVQPGPRLPGDRRLSDYAIMLMPVGCGARKRCHRL